MEKLVVIKTVEQLQELKDYLVDKDYVSYDTETTGLSSEAQIIGFSVSADVNTGYYVILSYWDVETQTLKDLPTKQYAKEIIWLLQDKKLIMHNAVFDCSMTFNNFQIQLMGSVHTDTVILSHLIDENRSAKLKDLGVVLFGQDAKKEQEEMHESIKKNGGSLNKDSYELYKADAELIGRYGAKDAILTLQIFYAIVPDLFEQGLDKFFYEEESMPLLRGPTYQLNTTGLKIDAKALQDLKAKLNIECLQLKAFVYKEIDKHVKTEYPGTSKAKTFNIGSSKQMAWLLYHKLGHNFDTLTDEGRSLCNYFGMRLPYSNKGKREFIQNCNQNKGAIWQQGVFNPKTGKTSYPKKVKDFWNYLTTSKDSLYKLSNKYLWVEKLLEYSKSQKILTTYVEGIEERMQYNIIHPNFLQNGTTSGRYSCRNPNFQNLPRSDKRVKSCIVSRPGQVFVGADYSQLEPRVFASFSKDEKLLKSFETGDDFYSVIGAEVFDKYDCSLKKDDPNSFANRYPQLRDIAKVVALSSTYGTTASKMAIAIGRSQDEAQEVIDNYFERFPSVLKMMKESHAQAKTNGVVHNLYGRPRRMPKALEIKEIYGNRSHGDLPYEARNLLNLAVNHRIQSSGASIINRAAIAFYKKCEKLNLSAKIVCQIHDELVIECSEEQSIQVAAVLKDAMENTVVLPGVKLIAEPKIGKNLAELK